MTPTEPTTAIPTTDCPKLLYVSTQGRLHLTTVSTVDREAVTDPRERALCRALLLHALALLDASEPTSPTGRAL